MPDAKKSVDEIFAEAIEIESSEQRRLFLEKVCQGDQDLHARVTGLIEAYNAAGSFLEKPWVPQEGTQASIGSDENPGETRDARLGQKQSSNLLEKSSTIGPYKLLQKIGEGGMGTVWMAEQEKPVRRRVALKIVKSSQADKQIIARFEAERQALAMMDHPNIAKVLDANQTEDGSPFLAMELVQGIPITKYCDQNKLTPIERLKLFVPVCKAIQHAHQKGILHRDLKPANVLVCIQDGKPVPKVIDFGLAKPLQHQVKLTDKTMFTEFGQVLGTVQYMSPEQAVLDALDVDTRSDIYSLGIMLYELLSGSTPVDQDTLKENALLKVLEIIREQDPPRPSIRLNSSKKQLAMISEQRQIQPSKLEQILRNELDWVVMKALEKDRTRRYESANDFALDIGRYLNGEAVFARPPTLLYRTSKYVRKNWKSFASGATVLALLIVGLALIAWIRTQAAGERTAKRVDKTISSLESGKGTAIPIILRQLDSLPGNLVLNELRHRYGSAADQNKRNLAYGLAHFGQVEIDTILGGLLGSDSDPDEVDNIVNAFRDEPKAVDKLKSKALEATKNENWNIKSRLAVVALHLGDVSLAEEMLRDRPANPQPKVVLPDLLTDFKKRAEKIEARPEPLRGSAVSRLELAEAYYVMGEYKKALIELDALHRLANASSMNWPAWYGISEELSKARNAFVVLANRIMKSHDTNKNGVLDANETTNARVYNPSSFRRIPSILSPDKNTNGEVTADELIAWRSSPGSSSRPSRLPYDRIVSCANVILEKYDRNKNGLLDKSETQTVLLPSSIDENTDKKISLPELILWLRSPLKSSSLDSSSEAIDKVVTNAVDAILKQHDTNGDGHLNESESEGIRSIHFGIDRDLDGKITWNELIVAYSLTGSISRAISTMRGYDKNGDGVLVAGEFEKIKRHRAGTDRDMDGRLTFAELMVNYSTSSSHVLRSESLLKRYDKDGNRNLDAEERKAWRSIPKQVSDKNGDHKIDFNELVVGLISNPNYSYSLNERIVSYAEAQLKKHDKDGNGSLDQKESTNLQLPARTYVKKDGNISWNELVVMFRSSTTVSSAFSIMDTYDVDADGTLNKSESSKVAASGEYWLLPSGTDRNRDGDISLEEMIVSLSLDPSLSLEQRSPQMKAMLDKQDRNRDGKLDDKELAKAIRFMEKVYLGSDRIWDRVVCLRAVCQACNGLEQQARKSLEELAALPMPKSEKPTWPFWAYAPPHVAFGPILVEAGLGNSDKAVEQMNKMIAESSNEEEALRNLAEFAAHLTGLCHHQKLPDESRFRDMALKLMRKGCVELRYRWYIETDSEFIPLHQDPGFVSLATEINPPINPFDPIQRTVFIREFAKWSGSTVKLTDIVASTRNQGLRSGICLALGGVKKPGQKSKDSWRKVLSDWYADEADSGTHSSSGWALSQWNLETPSIATTKNPPSDRAWWHEPNGIRFVKIKAGVVTSKRQVSSRVRSRSQTESGPIKVRDDFWLSDSEVTSGLFRKFMADVEFHAEFKGTTPKWTDTAENGNGSNLSNLPAKGVNWYHAVMFCNWLSKKLELDACYKITTNRRSTSVRGQFEFEVLWNREADGIRLPTPDEWEYACRNLTTTRFNFGNDENDLLHYGWFELNSSSEAQLIRGKKCNAWGLFDMHGNVAEWCWGPSSSQGLFSSSIGGAKGLRGGGWNGQAKDCQSWTNTSLRPAYRPNHQGFRVARGPSSQIIPENE